MNGSLSVLSLTQAATAKSNWSTRANLTGDRTLVAAFDQPRDAYVGFTTSGQGCSNLVMNVVADSLPITDHRSPIRTRNSCHFCREAEPSCMERLLRLTWSANAAPLYRKRSCNCFRTEELLKQLGGDRQQLGRLGLPTDDRSPKRNAVMPAIYISKRAAARYSS